MPQDVYQHAVELLLLSTYSTRGEDGLETKFLVGPPGAPSRAKRISTNIFFRRRKLIRAALYVRESGPVYLRAMSINDICHLLTRVVIDNYEHLASETLFKKIDCSYAEHLSATTKAKLAIILSTSDIFSPTNALTLYPLVPVIIEDDFDSSSFFLIRPRSLNSARANLNESAITAEEFPPLHNWGGRKERPGSWLGVWSPIAQASNKMKSAILGAVALTPPHRYRHVFSMRSMFGGQCVLDAGGGYAVSFGQAHTPAMSEDIVIRHSDHAWLTILASKLSSTDNAMRRQIRALEYFYRAWPLDGPERFPWLFMALDAIFGDSSRATQAVIEAIGKTGETTFEYERLRLLLVLRASVIHGGAPDVYDSDKYHRYYEDYGDDPISDLGLIATACLRSTIFGNALVEHPDPYADLIRAYRNGTLDRRRDGS
jgi:hypothetical protein